MSKLPKLSGEDVIKILVKKFGFEVSRQKGNHVTIVKHEAGRKIVTSSTFGIIAGNPPRNIG